MAKKTDKKRHRSKSPYSARSADKYELYQLSVQSPEPDVKFLARVYRKERGKQANHLREDFSGTALLTSHWVKRGKKFTAEAFDIDPEPVDWGRRRNFAPLGAAASRATLHIADVRAPSVEAPDVRCAQNFSYWVFKTREELLEYFRSVHRDLAPDGVFVLDAHGGSEAIEENVEETPIDGDFTYEWEQKSFSPVTHDALLYIHFSFPDGSRMKRAFRYVWRFWTLPEIRDVLIDAGFSRVDVYWEGTEEDGETGNGIYKKTRLGTNDPSWVAYVVALK